MSDIDIDAIRARAEAATPGPWKRDGSLIAAGILGHIRVGQTWGLAWKQDAEFIAHAREDVPALLDEVEQLRDHKWQMGIELRESVPKYVEAQRDRWHEAALLATANEGQMERERDRWKAAYEMAEPVLAERDRLAAQVQAVRALAEIAHEFDFAHDFAMAVLAALDTGSI